MITLSLLRGAGFFAGFSVVFAWLFVTQIGDGVADVGQVQPFEDATDPAAALVLAHDCWTNEAPAGVRFPGHVVVTRDGRAVYGGPRLTSLALDQVFGGADHDMTVVGFCR
jgi:hypothetical protein